MLCTVGLYPCVISCVALALHGLVVAFEGRWDATLRAVRSGAITAASMLVYAACKLLPVADFLRDHRRPIAADDAIGLPVLIDALLVKRTTETQIWPHVGYAYAWWGEYSNYIGWAGIALALAGLALAAPRFRRERWLVVLALALTIGDHGSYSPYAILRSLPLFGNLRVPTRYWVVVDLWLACLVAHAGWRLSRSAVVRLPRPARGVAFAALLGLAAGFTIDLVRTNGVALYRGAMPTPPAPASVRTTEFHQVLGGAWEMYKYTPRNLGSLRCFDELTVDISPALHAGLASEAYLLEADAGSARIARWSPSDWEIDLDLRRPTTLVVNQNAFRGWRAEGGVYAPHEGLVAVEVPAGRRTVRVWYRPVGYQLGAALTLAGLIGTAVLSIFSRRRDRAGAPA
jgi:hypothetical protein